MGTPIDLDTFLRLVRDESDWGRGWLVSEAFCMACGHEWNTTVPVGTKGNECPRCHFYDSEFVWAEEPIPGYGTDGIWLNPIRSGP